MCHSVSGAAPPKSGGNFAKIADIVEIYLKHCQHIVHNMYLRLLECCSQTLSTMLNRYCSSIVETLHNIVHNIVKHCGNIMKHCGNMNKQLWSHCETLWKHCSKIYESLFKHYETLLKHYQTLLKHYKTLFVIVKYSSNIVIWHYETLWNIVIFETLSL